jgi:hypothetical protein
MSRALVSMACSQDLVQRERLLFEQQRGVRRYQDLAVHADVLEQLATRVVTNGEQADPIQRLPHESAGGGPDQRARTDGIHHHRGADLEGEGDLTQEHLDVGVVEDASTAQDEQIEARHDLLGLQAGQRPSIEGMVDIVTAAGVFGVSGEDGDLDRQRTTQLCNHDLEDGLVAQVETTV